VWEIGGGGGGIREIEAQDGPSRSIGMMEVHIIEHHWIFGFIVFNK